VLIGADFNCDVHAFCWSSVVSSKRLRSRILPMNARIDFPATAPVNGGMSLGQLVRSVAVKLAVIGLCVYSIAKSSRRQEVDSLHRVSRGDGAGHPRTLLMALADQEFAWEASTTSIPISTASVWLKRLLSGGDGVPADLLAVAPPGDTIAVAPVRAWLNARRFERVIGGLCARSNGFTSAAQSIECDPTEVDPFYGLTPLHLAAASGDTPLYDWLIANGADASVEDGVGRKAKNLTFANFVSNSKKWARAAGRTHCDLPEVVFEEGGDVEHARSETRRIVSEGEPVLLRGALRYFAPQIIDDWSVERFVDEHAKVQVQVGSVPYASAFRVASTSMTLREYYETYVRPGDASDTPPLYIFDRDATVNKEGYEALAGILRDIFPIPHLIADPDTSGGVGGIHFYLGRSGSGAPLHIHADAANGLVSGSKKWFVYPPAATLYSRKPAKQWLDEEYDGIAEADKPLECVQAPGDIVYVPLDWGHAVVNLKENTFGYALELLNHRDTFHSFAKLNPASNDEL
jgi:Cupin-like domain